MSEPRRTTSTGSTDEAHTNVTTTASADASVASPAQSSHVDVAALVAERDRLVRELVFLRTGDVIGGSTERDELMHAVTTDRQEILRLRADLEQTLGVVHRLKAELDEARARIDDLESSTSWRITAPLRRMVAYRNRSGGH